MATVRSSKANNLARAALAATLILGAPAAALAQAQTQAAPFADQAQPKAPDYAQPQGWAAFGDRPSVSDVAPAGATPKAKAAKVDVFYVHPTTFRSTDHWNQDLADTAVNAWTDGSVIARQAGVFNGCCRIFAPRYRQASTLALTKLQGDGGKAFDLAYGDVEKAFDYYIAHENHGRPFILAGHSQGGSHIARLLERRIDGSPLRQRMVAAYVVGMNLAEGDFPRTYRNTPVCQTAAQLRCVVQWNAVLETADLDTITRFSEKRFVDRYGVEGGKTTLCVNPLTFDTSKPEATAALSLGSVPGAPDASALQPLRAHAVSARCTRGYLVVAPDPALNLQPLPGGSMHYHDLGLFYADVRANAQLRADAMLGQARRR